MGKEIKKCLIITGAPEDDIDYYKQYIDGRFIIGADSGYQKCVKLNMLDAAVVKLVYTLVSGTSASDSVQVRVLSWAPTTGPLNSSGPVYFFLMRKRPCAVAAALQPVVAPNTNPSTCMQPIGRTPPAHLPSVASVFSPTGRQRENAFLRCSIPIRHRAIHQLLTCSER